ncbi:MAG: hypothetical protein ACD_10C00102G0002 [uncultured bacterium]|nr:MAG: hypothetical protein ACD_10C00102G0002 [uncultured bacterium]
MQLTTGKLVLECLIDPLLTLNTALSDEFGTDYDGFKMLSIAIKGKMFAGHAGENEFFNFFGMHHRFRFLVSSPA